MLYYHETTYFEPDGKNGHWRSDYWEDFKDILVPHQIKRGMHVVGVWETPVGSGHGNEFTFLYRINDWADFGQFLDKRVRDMNFRERWSQQWVYRQRWYTRLLVPAPGHEAGLLHRDMESTVEPQGPDRRDEPIKPHVYYQETVTFEVDGKDGHWRSEYWEDFKAILAPKMAEWGMPLIGVWETPVGAGHGNEFTFLWRTDNWTTFGGFLDNWKADTEFRQRWSQQAVYRQQWYTKCLTAAPGHAISILHRQAD